MKRSLSIKLKAIFLLFVFSLSTLMSFACAAGLDMGYNRGHHKIQNNSSLTEGLGINQKVHHNHAPVGAKKSAADHDAITHHEKKDVNTKESSPDDCCRDEAAKFEKGDKINLQISAYNLKALFITILIKPTFNADAVTSSLHNPNSRYLIRNHHPPIADTRIAIQSFLI